MDAPISISGTLTLGPYLGYYGRAEFDGEENVFHGAICDTRDVVTFVGEDSESVRQAFKESIDDYLALCHERGVDPEKPFSGNFMVRATPDLHKRLSQKAQAENVSLNQLVVRTLDESLGSKPDSPKTYSLAFSPQYELFESQENFDSLMPSHSSHRVSTKSRFTIPGTWITPQSQRGVG